MLHCTPKSNGYKTASILGMVMTHSQGKVNMCRTSLPSFPSFLPSLPPFPSPFPFPLPIPLFNSIFRDFTGHGEGKNRQHARGRCRIVEFFDDDDSTHLPIRNVPRPVSRLGRNSDFVSFLITQSSYTSVGRRKGDRRIESFGCCMLPH